MAENGITHPYGNTVMRRLLFTAAALLPLIFGYAYANQNWAPKSWSQDKVTMGTLYDNSQPAKNALSQRPVSAIFNYAGQGGDGDRGEVVPPTKITNTMGDVLGFADQVTPIFVIYTANASGGGTGQALIDITDYTNLLDHYQTLYLAIDKLEQYAQDPTAPVTATVLFNPDFIGHLHQSNINPSAALTISGNSKDYTIQQVLQNVLTAQGISNVTVPDTFDGTPTLIKYFQSINWMMGEFAPDIPYGIQDNDWAGTTDGNLWLHMENESQTHVDQTIQTNAKNTAAFIQSLQVMQPVNTDHGNTQPSFIAFDKYGANPIFNGNYQFVTQGYLFNSDDWFNYINYVSAVGKALDDAPIMLFQMPGAHLPTQGDRSPYQNLATMPDYVFGDDSLNLNAFVNIPGTIPTANYHITQTQSPEQYLQLHQQGNGETLWQTNHLALLKQDHIFAILWGGGGYATGVIPQATGFDDNGWLYAQIKNTYNTGLVAIPQAKPKPDPGKLPRYPNDEPYHTGNYVLGTDSNTYQCKITSWCNGTSNSPYAPGKGADWQAAWSLIQ